MDKLKIKNRYEEALKLKSREQYAKALKDELSKQEWKDELDDLSTHMESIASEKEYEKFMNKLVDLFDKVYEKIAAPGLDKFIEWIKENSVLSSSRTMRSIVRKLMIFWRLLILCLMIKERNVYLVP